MKDYPLERLRQEAVLLDLDEVEITRHGTQWRVDFGESKGKAHTFASEVSAAEALWQYRHGPKADPQAIGVCIDGRTTGKTFRRFDPLMVDGQVKRVAALEEE